MEKNGNLYTKALASLQKNVAEKDAELDRLETDLKLV